MSEWLPVPQQISYRSIDTSAENASGSVHIIRSCSSTTLYKNLQTYHKKFPTEARIFTAIRLKQTAEKI